jgi:hypothetical protein
MTAERVSGAIGSLLAFGGASTRRREPIEDSVVLIDYRNTAMNERRIDALLSSQGIPFHIEPPGEPGMNEESRLALLVPRERHEEAAALLSLAAGESALEVVEGTGDLLQR